MKITFDIQKPTTEENNRLFMTISVEVTPRQEKQFTKPKVFLTPKVPCPFFQHPGIIITKACNHQSILNGKVIPVRIFAIKSSIAVASWSEGCQMIIPIPGNIRVGYFEANQAKKVNEWIESFKLRFEEATIKAIRESYETDMITTNPKRIEIETQVTGLDEVEAEAERLLD